MKRAPGLLLSLLGSTLLAAGCLAWEDLSSQHGAPPPAGSGGSGGAEADAGLDADADAGPELVCPSGRGPLMVAVPPGDVELCIDSTEVTRAQYGQFVDALDGGVPGPGGECVENDDVAAPTIRDDAPVHLVDWCDAKAFCAWSGKRLCGPRNGLSMWDTTDAGQSEWAYVCRAGGDQPYPYGYEPVLGRCAFEDVAEAQPVAAGSLPGCEGGFPGVYDMTGNVWEWTDGCHASDAGPDASTTCDVMGGSYDETFTAGCSENQRLERKFASSKLGFRCCATPAPAR